MCKIGVPSLGEGTIRRWLPQALVVAPLCVLLLVAATIIRAHWTPAIANGVAWMAVDTGHYVAIADGLRHGAIHPILSLHPPGFPIILALMPAALTVTTAVVAGLLGFLAVLVLLYVVALRYGGVAAATVSGIAWLLLLHFSPDTPALPISDNAFVAVALVGLIARRPVAVGAAGGFAMLTRPEGMMLVALLTIRQLHVRRAFIVLAVAVAVYAPYLVVLHSLNGQWMITGKHQVNWQVAPYRVAGVSNPELNAMGARFGFLPPPTDNRVVAIIGPAQRARARLLMLDVPFRMRVNLRTWWIALRQIAPLPLLGLGLLGVCVCIWRRRFGPLSDAVCLVIVSFGWLPYFYIGHRGMLAAFAALALLAGVSILPVVSWVRHIKSAGIL